MPRTPVLLLVSWLAFLLAAPALRAQGDDSSHVRIDSTTAAEAASGADRARALERADSGSFDPEAATEAYMAKLSPEARARSDAYFEGGYWLLLWGFLYGIGVAWILLATGLSARMRDIAERITRIGWLQTGIYAVEYIVLTAVLTFPLTLYQGFFREHRFGLSNQSFPEWMRDELVGLAVGVVLGAIALILIYVVIRRTPRNWWIWGAGVAIVLMVLGAMIAPVYIAPLFNTYKPLPESELRAQLLSMARANGIPADNVYVFDASKQSKRISANVSGMFGTVRISLNDNLMNRGTPEEIRAVLGHEMGHYVLNHVYEGVIYFGIIIVVGFAFAQWAFGRLAARW
ncbi:MAG TPA: M48 family metallopeptidase, partial [Gemmatimonadaceae bacterium]|nr:M48 family metallopeptidase [Gemmatimonadaceae bacterium]